MDTPSQRTGSRPRTATALTLRQKVEIAILEYGTAAEAWAALACARAGIHFCFRRLAPWVLATPSFSPLQKSDDAERTLHPHLKARLARSVERAASFLPGTSLCLPRAIAAKWMLARRGYPSTIHLGVGKKEDRSLHAHAWLEAGGTILTGAGAMGTVTPILRPGGPTNQQP